MGNTQSYQRNQEQCQIIKPKICNKLLIIQSLIIAFPTSIFTSMFFGMPFIIIASMIFRRKIFILLPIAFILYYLIIAFTIFFLRKKSLKKTVYKFYNNKIEYFDGFLVINRKTIAYNKISNISQTKGIIEKMFGLGTIHIDTAGSSNSGYELSISYLENSTQIYDWISKITSYQQ